MDRPMIVLWCLIAAVGCEADPASGDPGAGALLVITTDYESGTLVRLDPDSGTVSSPLRVVHPDTTLRLVGDTAYLVERLGADRITALDRDDLALRWQRSTGPGSNPQDLAAGPDGRLWVSRLEETALLILDPDDGGEAGRLDLGALADADGYPEPAGMIRVGDRVVVAVQRLDRNDLYRPTGPAALAVIDPAAERIERTVELQGANPYGDPIAGGGRILVTAPGRFGELDGGIEAVDPGRWVSEGWVVRESDLGGDVLGVVEVEGVLWVLTSDPAFATALVRWDPDEGGAGRVVLSTPDFSLGCVARVGRRLAVCDRTRTRPGVRLLGLPDGVEEGAGPIDVGLPPFLVRGWE